mmetsp:Transcript_27257/g.64984  ORF Transcript_27257/g.64984 Transcript_27257/m.64984 type:complete len:264 (-) Transcript_27257:1905-2696(-)
MIRFTQSSCTGFRGVPNPVIAPTMQMKRATTLTVSWNCRNRLMLSYTDLPQRTLLTMEEKLSSMMTMSEASCATEVPAMPMERPTSASLRAGASLVPSPVTATTSPISLRRFTSVSLSCGLHRAITWRVRRRSRCSPGDLPRKSGPSIAVPDVRIPHSRAMFLAVRSASPVSIRTVIPARWHCRTASGTSLRSGSLIPTTHTTHNPCSSASSASSVCGTAFSGTSRVASASVRSPCDAIFEMYWLMRVRVSSWSTLAVPFSVR